MGCGVLTAAPPLAQVIKALSRARPGAHVPYRDATLTKLLSDALGGSALTLMVACVSPLEAYTEESHRTLQYAAAAGNIRNRPVVKRDPQQQLIVLLKEEARHDEEGGSRKGGGAHPSSQRAVVAPCRAPRPPRGR